MTGYKKGMHTLYAFCTDLTEALGKHVLQNRYDLSSYKFHLFSMKWMDILNKVGHKTLAIAQQEL